MRHVSALLLNDSRCDLHHGCIRVVQAIASLAQDAGIEITASIPSHTDWRRDAKALRAFGQANLVIVNGEGSIHHDRTEGQWLMDAGTYARSLSIPAALINTSWQQNGSAVSAKLNDFSLISARDARSAAEISSYGVTCRIVPDLSLYRDGPKAASRSGIGFTDSVVPEIDEGLESLRRRISGQYTPIHFSDTGLKGFTRFVRAAVGKRDLLKPVRLVQKLLRRAGHYSAQFATDEQMLAHLARLELLVSGRFHAATLALAARTPIVAACPAPTTRATDGNKLRGLIEGAGLEGWRITSVESITPSLIAEASRWHSDEAARVDSYLREGRSRMRALFADIRKLV